MQKLLIMTDIHLRLVGETIIGLDPQARFARALNHALITHPDAARLIIMGDLAHDGTVVEYVALKSAIAHVKIPTTLMIGNHDERDTFHKTFHDVALDKYGFVQCRIELDDHILICLDTKFDTDIDDARPIGMFCEKRLAWLREQLEQSSDKPVLIFMHHPPFKVGFPGMDAIRLNDGHVLLELLADFKNVKHLFAGHIHRTISGNAGGISFSIFKSTCDQMPMDLVNFDAGLSIPEPAAYGIVLLDGENIIVHSEDYDIAGASNAPRDGAIL